MSFNHPFRTFLSLFAKSRVRALLTTIIIAMLGVLTILLPGAVLGQADEQPTVVLVPKRDFPEVADIPARYTVDYGPVVWLELTPAAFGQLQGRGVDFTSQPEATILHFDRYQFDPLVQLPALPPEEQAAPTTGVPGLFVVQLIGLPKDEWLTDLKSRGAEIVGVGSGNSYVVRMMPEQIALLKPVDYVRWAGPFHPAYKISSFLRDGRASRPMSGIIENVYVTIYGDGAGDSSVQQTIEAIASLGGVFLGQEKMSVTKPRTGAIFKLPMGALVPTARLENVIALGFRVPQFGPEDEMSAQIVAGNHSPVQAGYQQWLAQVGLSGAGVTAGLVDTGYDTGDTTTVHEDVRGRFIPVGNVEDLHGHGTHIGGIIAGEGSTGITDTDGFLMGLGVAPDAHLLVTAHQNDPDGLMTVLQRNIVANGGHLSNNSYFTNDAGEPYGDDDEVIDRLVRDGNDETPDVAEPLPMIFSVGNCGNSPNESPCFGDSGPTKQAKNIVAVGATLNQREDVNGREGIPDYSIDIDRVRDASSRGPTEDGRIYPHVVAPGGPIISTRSSVCTDVDERSCGNYAVLTTNPVVTTTQYTVASGTSQAAAHTSGAVALIIEWWREFHANLDPSPAMIKALLVNTAEDIAGGTSAIPNNEEGWGRIDVSRIVSPSVPFVYLDQSVILTDQFVEWNGSFVPADPNQPVKVTLAWTDPPATTPQILINDLDLRVNDGATSYRGNQFLNGFSAPNPVAYDHIDNVENIFIENPTGGTIDITLWASTLLDDGVPHEGDATDQDFALVIQNAVPVNVDVALIIDSSGSMISNDPDDRRLDAAHAYLTASADGDYVGVVDFDGTAETASPALRLPENSETISAAISTIDSSGSTNIGLGVAEGYDVLSASPSENVVKAGILLTDGQGAFDDQHVDFAEQGWPIYAFGFGDADDALLTEIATSTGGEYERLPTSNLVCEFQAVRARIAGAQPQACQTVHVSPGQTVTLTQNVPAGQGQATFSTSWPGSDVVMTLTAPSGRVIDRDTTAPDVTHDLGATYETYAIDDPEDGEWEVSLFGADLPAGGEDVVYGFTSLPQTEPSLTVNSTGDGGDATPGDGACDDGAGNCTLRAAIQEANALPGADTIAFDIPGAGPHTIQPQSPLTVITDTVTIDGTTEPDYAGNPVVELDGTNAGAAADGITIEASNSVIRGLAVNRFDDDGITAYIGATGTLIEGNYVGIDVTGSSALGNLGEGINVRRVGSVTIGGTTMETRNLVSGNGSDGIEISYQDAEDVLVQGNYIGTDASGTLDLGNGYNGVRTTNNASSNTIGSTVAGGRNLISGNDFNGIEIVNADADGNIIQNNYIGTDSSGLVALANYRNGILIHASQAGSTIGGMSVGAGNAIAGNGGNGIYIRNSTDVFVHSNLIGVGADGTTSLGNTWHGVRFKSDVVTGNVIGGVEAGAGNTIAHNGRSGVDAYHGSENVIRGNNIFANGHYGIDLGTDGVTTNDAGDGDTGPNELQNYPLLSGAASSASSTTITGTLNSVANTQFTLDFYASDSCDSSGYGEGERYLGSDTVTTDGNGDAGFVSTVSESTGGVAQVTATATDLQGNTSEFSACVQASYEQQ